LSVPNSYIFGCERARMTVTASIGVLRKYYIRPVEKGARQVFLGRAVDHVGAEA
jgi:hypothetical protein